MISFAAPWVLPALLVAAVPILLRLFARREPPEVEFPAVRYLSETARVHQHRLNLQHLLLLLARTLLVVVLVLAAAGPSAPSGSAGQHASTALVLVLDNSLSSGVTAGGVATLDRLREVARGVLDRATPADALWLVTADGVPRLMQGVGRDYVRCFNRRHGRSGTLWEGRYRSTLIQAERHLLSCMVFIDLDPVREGLCADAQSYLWSSHRHHAGQAQDRHITPHAMYWALGNTPFAREAAYADLVRAGLNAQQMGAIANSLWHGWALGDPDYLASLSKDTDRRLMPARAGRPKKTPP